MQRRLKILYLPHPPQLRFPWMADVEKALNSQHQFRVYDEHAPLKPQIEDADVVVDHGGGHSTRAMADAAASAKLWQILGTGFENFDVPYWRSKGIPVANTPGPFSAPALAETALMFMLMLAHRWHQGEADLRRKFLYGTMGEELEDRLLLLFGFGASARALASRALGCGMRIAAVEVQEVSEADRRAFKLEAVGKPEDL